MLFRRKQKGRNEYRMLQELEKTSTFSFDPWGTGE